MNERPCWRRLMMPPLPPSSPPLTYLFSMIVRLASVLISVAVAGGWSIYIYLMFSDQTKYIPTYICIHTPTPHPHFLLQTSHISHQHFEPTVSFSVFRLAWLAGFFFNLMSERGSLQTPLPFPPPETSQTVPFSNQ